jgi:hypothetical protein
MNASVLLAAVLAILVLGLQCPGAQQPAAPSDLVQQVQAAHVLADVMTFVVERADARLNEAEAYLNTIGKKEAYEHAKPAPALGKPLYYTQLFKGAIAFVEGDGVRYADPSTNDESVSQLYNDLSAAQYYNIHQFLHFNQQRQEFASLRSYLESIGQWDKFLATGSNNAPTARLDERTSSQPALTPLELVSRRMGETMKFIRETACKDAQAKGISETDFNSHWPAEMARYRRSVISRIESAQPLEGVGKTEMLGTPPPQPRPEPAIAQPPVVFATPQAAPPQPPPPVPSPYTNALFRARDNTIWDMWDANPVY